MSAREKPSLSGQQFVIAILAVQVVLLGLLLFRIQKLEQSIVNAVNVNDQLSLESAAYVEGASVDDDPSLGPATAPVTIIEFADYECPYCAESATVLRQLLTKYPNELRLVYRDFPMPGHENATNAALAAECADEQGLFWEMHDLLFANPTAHDADSLERYAQQIGISVSDFRVCMSSQRYADEIERDVADGRSYGVHGTPAFFINGYRHTGFTELAMFEGLISEALSK